MRKIKQIKQLRAEQKFLLQRESELESTIQKNWIELRESMKPMNIAKDVFSNWRHKQLTGTKSGKGLLVRGLTAGTVFLAKNLVGKLGVFL